MTIVELCHSSAFLPVFLPSLKVDFCLAVFNWDESFESEGLSALPEFIIGDCDKTDAGTAGCFRYR